MKRKTDYICTMCYPGGEDIAKITTHFFLCKYNGKYCIVHGPGHKDDIIFTYEIDPVSSFQRLKKTYGFLTEKSDIAVRGGILVCPQIGHKLYEECMKECHYNPEKDGGNFELWLFFLCGKLMLS